MKYLFLFLFLFSASVTAFSQVTLQGKVVDKGDSSIAYASVIISKKGKPAIVKLTSEDGSFKVIIDSMGTYDLKVTYSSYTPFSKKIIVNTSVHNETIVLQKEGKELGGVTVTARSGTDFIERKIDRVIMNVEANALTVGRNLLDLLSLAPGVFINYNGTIFIGGVPGTRVMINGKLVNLVGTDLNNFLRGLRADDVKSIEIIKNPGAEYDASGSGGLVNFILKRSYKTGLNGSVGADFVKGIYGYPGYSVKGSLNFQTGKLGITSSLSQVYQKDFVNLTQKREFPGSGFYTSQTRSIRYLTTNNVRISAIYTIDKKQYIGLDFTGQYRNYREENPGAIKIKYPDATKNTRSDGSYPVKANSDLSTVGFNYSLTTDTLGSKFILLADYSHFNKNTLSKNESQTFNDGGGLLSDTTFDFINPTKTRIATADARYDKNFKSGLKLSFGGRIGNTRIRDNNNYDIFNGSTWVRDSALAFDYDYKERVYAGFTNLSGKVAKIDYKIGVRAEYSDIESTLTGGQSAAYRNNYLSFFPDVFFRKNTKKGGVNFISLTYNRRITRPSFSQLNPYRYFVDNFSVKTGNPFLVPQFANKFALGMLMRSKYFFELSYTSTIDMISQFNFVDPQTGIGTLTNGNVGRSEVYAATISAPFQIMKSWTTNNTFVVNYTKSVADGLFDIGRTSLFIQSGHTYKFTPTFMLNVNFFYIPNIVLGNTVVRDIGTLDFGLLKRFYKDKFTVRAALNHMAFPDKVNGIVYFGKQVIYFKDDEQRRFASISFTYNFNSGKAVKVRKIENSNTNEINRLQ